MTLALKLAFSLVRASNWRSHGLCGPGLFGPVTEIQPPTFDILLRAY